MGNRLLHILSRIFLHGIPLFIVFIPWIALQVVDKPFRRGFFCNDETIRYPFKPSTVTNTVLTTVGFLLSFFMICLIEFICYMKSKESEVYPISQNTFIPFLIVRIYHYFGVFLFGLAIQQTLVNIGKYSIGRLRPHFFDVCKPNFAALNCTVKGTYLYVEDYKCQDETTSRAIESRLSFPSGHSSFSTYVAIYLTLYLQSRLVSFQKCKCIKFMAQVLMIYAAFYTCLSRVSDNKHHYTDVFAGAFIGFFTAAIAAIHGTDLYAFEGGYLVHSLGKNLQVSSRHRSSDDNV